MNNKLSLGLLLISLLGSSAAFAGSGSSDESARNCLAQEGSGKTFAWSYKNPGFNGKPCTRAIKVYACKGSSCQLSDKGSDATGTVTWNKKFFPGFTPKSSALKYQ